VRATSRSPVAIGVLTRLAIFAMAHTFSGGHGFLPQAVVADLVLDDDGGDSGAGFGVEIYSDIDVRAQAFAQHLDVVKLPL